MSTPTTTTNPSRFDFVILKACKWTENRLVEGISPSVYLHLEKCIFVISPGNIHFQPKSGFSLLHDLSGVVSFVPDQDVVSIVLKDVTLTEFFHDIKVHLQSLDRYFLTPLSEIQIVEHNGFRVLLVYYTH